MFKILALYMNISISCYSYFCPTTFQRGIMYLFDKFSYFADVDVI